MDAAIITKNLVRTFGETRAIDGLSLRVERGEMFGLIGPDGAGKSTTIRVLTGVLRPDSGEAEVMGCDLYTETDQLKERIGYLSQQFSLYGDLSIDENIEFFAQIHNVTGFRKRRDELLEFTRLTPFRKRLADRLSGGMKQKLALACTLIHRPEIIMLDEPTTGVDPVSRRDFWLILADLLRNGITIIMTSPYLDEAERCHRVGLMNNGRLLRCDTPKAIVDELQGVVLEISTDEPHEAYRILRERGSVAQMFGETIHTLVDDASTGNALRSHLEAEGVEVRDVREIPAQLEDAFIELIRRDRQ
jgi:ABC-2 type transport system ATP-binding protein